MVKFLNAFTGTIMFVSDTRIEEYKAAGHKLVADAPQTDKKTVTKKKTTKK